MEHTEGTKNFTWSEAKQENSPKKIFGEMFSKHI